MKRYVPVLAIVTLFATLPLLSGCGGEEAVAVGPVPSVEERGAPASSPPSQPPSSEPAATAPAATVTYEVWFTLGDGLYVTRRSQETTPRVGTAALEALLAGPSAAEAAAGVRSAVPGATRLLGLSVEGGIATVDLSSEFEAAGGSRSMFMRLAQVVYTLTQFPTVDAVRFRLDGRQVDVFSGEGIVLDHPVTRRDYEELLPAIIVETPVPGERVSSPVKVEGSANVFEANVVLRVLDARGKEIASDFTTATCGTGCRGDFSHLLDFSVEKEQPGTIVASDDDADGDGRPQHEISIPVVLAPRA